MSTLEAYPLAGAVKSALLDLAARSDLLIFGEIHGTQEVPRLLLGLLEELAGLGYGGLGLEAPVSQREELLLWVQGKASSLPSFFGPMPFRDGRGNEQVLWLLKQVLEKDAGWRLLCFEGGGSGPVRKWAERDARMAVNLLEQWEQECPGQKVVAICGNMHSRLVPPTFSMDSADPFWPSFAANVQQLRNGVRVSSIEIIFHSGSFFNGEPRPVYPVSPRIQAEAEIRASESHTMALHLPRATPVTFPEPAGWSTPAAG